MVYSPNSASYCSFPGTQKIHSPVPLHIGRVTWLIVVTQYEQRRWALFPSGGSKKPLCSQPSRFSSLWAEMVGGCGWLIELLDGHRWDHWVQVEAAALETLDLQWTSCPWEITSCVIWACLLLQHKPSLSWLTYFNLTNVLFIDTTRRLSNCPKFLPKLNGGQINKVFTI